MTTTKEEYDFDNRAAILKAIDDLPNVDKTAYNEQLRKIEVAARAFLHTRTNSELMDMKDSEPSFWDYVMFCDWFEEEEKHRSWPDDDTVNSNILTLQQILLAEYSGEESVQVRLAELRKQVAGIQKKVDRITDILENFSVTMKVSEVLRLK